RPNAEHPTPQAVGHPAGADAGVWGPGAPRHPSTDGLLVAPPHPWHRPPGAPVSEPSACSTSDRYSPLEGGRGGSAGCRRRLSQALARSMDGPAPVRALRDDEPDCRTRVWDSLRRGLVRLPHGRDPERPGGRLLNLYVCGITPYDSGHLGHAFTFCAFDVL